MNYNDIDYDVKHHALEGLNINDLLKDHYGINLKHYTELLLLLPNDAEKRNEIHQFLEVFSLFLENGEHNSDRELGEDFTYSNNGINFLIFYQVIKGFNRITNDPTDYDDEEIRAASLINTELPEDAWNWLNYQCKVVLSNWESFNF